MYVTLITLLTVSFTISVHGMNHSDNSSVDSIDMIIIPYTASEESLSDLERHILSERIMHIRKASSDILHVRSKKLCHSRRNSQSDQFLNRLKETNKLTKNQKQSLPTIWDTVKTVNKDPSLGIDLANPRRITVEAIQELAILMAISTPIQEELTHFADAILKANRTEENTDDRDIQETSAETAVEGSRPGRFTQLITRLRRRR